MVFASVGAVFAIECRVVVAVFDAAVFVAQVEAVALAVAKHAAVGADACFHPAVVAVLPIAVLPYVPEVVGVDVALGVIGTDARAGGNRAVDEYRAGGHAGGAAEEMAAYVALVVAEEAFAAV